MRTRALLSLAAVAAALTTAGGAPADTLFTTPSHTARVTAGATASVASGLFTSTGTLGGQEVSNFCTSSTLGVQIEQNDDTGLVGTFTSGTFSGCTVAATGVFPWRFTVSGTGVTSGTSTVFANATWDDVELIVSGLDDTVTLTDATGSPPANGVFVRQTTTSGTGICFVLSDAAFPSPILTDGKLNGTFCLEGAPATSWSLGTTETPPVTLPPATLYTTAAHTTRVTAGATGTLSSSGTVYATSGTSVFNVCESSDLSFTLASNTAGLVSGTVTSGSFSSCAPFTSTPTFPWTLTVAGDGAAASGTSTFINTSLTNVRTDLLGGLYSGTLTAATGSPPSNGLFTTQPTVAGAPVCFVMSSAGTLSGPLSSNLRYDGRYCFTSHPAATWSLT